MWAAGQHDRVVNHNGEWEAESVRILRNPGGGSGMKGHSCLYASTSDARRNDGKRPGRMFSIIGPACQARLIKTLVLTVLMTWHIDQLKPKTPLLVALAGCLWILVHMCAHERSLLSFSANRKPSWLLRGGGARVHVSESGPMGGKQHKQWECRWVLLFCLPRWSEKYHFWWRMAN